MANKKHPPRDAEFDIWFDEADRIYGTYKRIRRLRRIMAIILSMALVFLLAAALNLAAAGELPAGHDCKKEWIQACVGSDQDKYRDWKPPPMYTIEQQLEIIKRSRHVCEFDNRGECADWPKEIRAGSVYDRQMHDGGDGTVNME